MTEDIETIKAIASDSKARINRIVANYEELEKENAELREQVEEMRKCLDKWYSQYGDKDYTEYFYKCLLEQTKSFLFTDVSVK